MIKISREESITFLSAVIIFVSGTVMAGWIFDIAILRKIFLPFEEMKFMTGVCFFSSGFMLNAAARGVSRGLSLSPLVQIVLPATLLVNLLFLGTVMVSYSAGIDIRVESLFRGETFLETETSRPVRPSLGTELGFVLVSIAGILTMLNAAMLQRKFFFLGLGIAAVGLIAVAGHIFHQPSLCFQIEDFSESMSLYSAVLFLLLGSGFVLIGNGHVH